MKHLLLILSMMTVGFVACDEKKEDAPDAAAKPVPTVSATASTTAVPTAVATTTASAVAEPTDAGKSDAGKPPKK